MKILLLEDDDLIADTVMNFEDAHEFVRLRDGSEGLDFLGKLKGFDLIVSDFNMPKVNGVYFIEQLRKISLTPVILYSSDFDILSNRERLQEVFGINEVLSKNVETLYEMIKKYENFKHQDGVRNDL